MGRGDSKASRVTLDSLMDGSRRASSGPVVRKTQEGNYLTEEWFDPDTGDHLGISGGPTSRVTSTVTGIIDEEWWESSIGSLHREGGLPARILYDKERGHVVQEDWWEFGKRVTGPYGMRTCKRIFDEDGNFASFQLDNIDNEQEDLSVPIYDHEIPSYLCARPDGSIERMAWMKDTGDHREEGFPSGVYFWDDGTPKQVEFAVEGDQTNSDLGPSEMRFSVSGNITHVVYSGVDQNITVFYDGYGDPYEVDGGYLEDDGTVTSADGKTTYSFAPFDVNQFRAENQLQADFIAKISALASVDA